jgi:glycosyl-4,4'-diaponeurosporenoate acyltransferase
VAGPLGDAVTARTAVLVDVAVWGVWGVAVGLAGARLAADGLLRDRWLTKIRPWERQGLAWRRLGVRRWKDRLPEAGTMFGGASKRVLPGRSANGLQAFAAETRRAEYAHWVAPVPLLAMVWWNPLWVTACMAVYAVAANAPCIVVQRYNRGRIEGILRCRQLRLPLPSAP